MLFVVYPQMKIFFPHQTDLHTPSTQTQQPLTVWTQSLVTWVYQAFSWTSYPKAKAGKTKRPDSGWHQRNWEKAQKNPLHSWDLSEQPKEPMYSVFLSCFPWKTKFCTKNCVMNFHSIPEYNCDTNTIMALQKVLISLLLGVSQREKNI